MSETALLAVGVARRTFTGGLGSLNIRCINCNATHFECECEGGKGQHKLLSQVANTIAPPLSMFTYCKYTKGTIKLETGGMHGGLGITQDYRQHGGI